MTQPPPSGDLDLVRRVRAGDRAALEELVGRLQCVPRMLASKNAKLGRPLRESELADLTQDVLVVVWKKLPEFRAQAALETWVYGICLLELLWKLRKERRVPGLMEDLGLRPPETSGEPAPLEVDYERVHRSLLRLDPDEAEVVRLKHFADLPFSGIGRALGLSPNTVKARYYRGLLHLRRLMGAETPERTIPNPAEGGPR